MPLDAYRSAEPPKATPDDASADATSSRDDIVVLGVAFFLGAVIVVAGLIGEEATTTPTAIGLIIMAFSASSFVCDVWRARPPHVKKP
ncbi:MAG: hypothetical protein JWP87_323 [Labilithrix sp.]|nr:hypothetical protein [Labilithrix sp.]